MFYVNSGGPTIIGTSESVTIILLAKEEKDAGEFMNQKQLLILQNAGFISRFYIDGLVAGAKQLGIACDVLEMGPI